MWESSENICLSSMMTYIMSPSYMRRFMMTYIMPAGDGPSCICHHISIYNEVHDDFNDDFNIVCHDHI